MSGTKKSSNIDLVPPVREHWYGNKPREFRYGDIAVSREAIQRYGGPIPRLASCPTCQRMEWFTRVTGKNQWRPHGCDDQSRAVYGKCSYWSAQRLCEMRESEDWVQNHQNFEFAYGIDEKFNAPKCIVLLFKESSVSTRFFRLSSCDGWVPTLRRQLAQCCQVDPVVYEEQDIDWDKYDFCFLDMSPNMPLIDIPIPLVLLGYDWIDTSYQYQGILDHYRPEIFLTPYPCSWKEVYRFPLETKIRFYSIAPTTFFIRPNVHGEKKYDIISLGKAWAGIYRRRIELHAQISELADEYRIHISKKEGVFRSTWDGPTSGTKGNDYWCYLNAYARLLGSAQYVTYGPLEIGPEPLMGKYYECLSSGAIPILPDSPDRSYIGVTPWKHYIPLSEIWQDNDRLRELLDNPRDYMHIAHNAVAWTYENMDRQVFDGFESVVREITGYRYARRIVKLHAQSGFPIDLEFNDARLSHLRSLGLQLRNKRVLEVGAGIGMLTELWEELDCDIVSTEGRSENIDYNIRHHPWRHNYVLQQDVMDKDSYKRLGLFDIVFCYGLLYHVPDPAFVIENLSRLCTGLMLIDSMVNIKDKVLECSERTEWPSLNQGIYDMARTPSRAWFMRELKKYFPYVYLPRKQPRNHYFPTEWPIKPGCIGRAIFVASRQKLSDRTFSQRLLQRQWRDPSRKNLR